MLLLGIYVYRTLYKIVNNNLKESSKEFYEKIVYNT